MGSYWRYIFILALVLNSYNCKFTCFMFDSSHLDINRVAKYFFHAVSVNLRTNFYFVWSMVGQNKNIDEWIGYKGMSKPSNLNVDWWSRYVMNYWIHIFVSIENRKLLEIFAFFYIGILLSHSPPSSLSFPLSYPPPYGSLSKY